VISSSDTVRSRPPGWWSDSRRVVWTRAASHGAFGAVPLLVTAFFLSIAIGHHNLAIDFESAFWPAGHRVLAGLTPYASPHSFAATHGFAFVYPAPGALLFAAFAWMPSGVAAVLLPIICVASALGVLAIVGVRDWRLYGLTLMWPAVISGWQTANVSLPLAFGTAIAWRFRNRPLIAGLTIGVIVSIIWRAAQRRPSPPTGRRPDLTAHAAREPRLSGVVRARCSADIESTWRARPS
jgi:hypothetical protein